MEVWCSMLFLFFFWGGLEVQVNNGDVCDRARCSLCFTHTYTLFPLAFFSIDASFLLVLLVAM
jgi:hypothetical protein